MLKRLDTRMLKIYRFLGIALCLFMFHCSTPRVHENKMIYDIPVVDHIVLDGKLDDWTNQGFQFELTTNTDGVIDRADFQADIRIGWNDEGLLIACRVRDDSVVVSQRQIYDNDGLELFVSKMPGTSRMLQYIIPAAAIAGQDEYRADRYDFRISQPTPDTRDIRVGTQHNDDQYTIEALVPLSELGIPGQANSEFALQLLFDDTDGGGRRSKQRYSWNYYPDTYLNNQALHRVRLVKDATPGTAVPYQVVANLVDDKAYAFTFIADSSLAGQPIDVGIGDQTFFSGQLVKEKGLAVASCSIDAGIADKRTDEFEIYIDHIPRYALTSGDVNYISSGPQPVPAHYEYDIRLYELRTAQHPPSDSAILFLGSSSIRLWSTLESDFPGYDVVKCGFGGSKTGDVVWYFDRIVKPFPYKKIVLYCGTNDINARVPVDTVVHNIQTIIEKTRDDLPDCRLLLLSNSVSVSRRKEYDKVVALNQWYQKLADQHDHVEYIDVFTPLLNARGGIRPELFSGDSTHMNPKGYAIWTKVLLDELK